MHWIWIKEKEKNTFAEFERTFLYNNGRAVLRVSADYRFAAFVNGRMVSNGQYADLPDYKAVNSVDITPYTREGENVLRVLAWHMGEDCSVCRTMTPAVAFEIVIDGKTVAQSDKNTLARKAVGYRAGNKITNQLGYGFSYDFTAIPNAWENAVEVETGFVEVERPIKQTTVEKCCVSKMVAQGVFRYREGTEKCLDGEKMQKAWLSSTPFMEMTGKNRLTQDTLASPITFTGNGGDGVFVIADMGRETCGHLSFSITVDKPCKMLLGWGEHLSDLRVRTAVGGRNFAMTVQLKAGENTLDDYLFRLGCRYLCVFVETDCFTLSRLGICEVRYPFSFIEKDFGDTFYNQIYELGRRTLALSAHEHYEDCPWREQALYGMDSRNQMLFGYGAFSEYELPRATISMFAHSLREDGLIALTPPARQDITIPSFTAYWLIAIGENAEVDYNENFIKEILPYAERSLNALLKQEGKYGLSLYTNAPYWNFHEWSEGLDGGEIVRAYEIDEEGDAGLTALTAVAARKIAQLWERLGDNAKAQPLYEAAGRLEKALNGYYDEEKGVYASYIKEGKRHGYHEYTQAVMLFTEGVSKERIKTLCAALKNPKAYKLIPATFAALQLKYDALIKYENDYAYCLQEIKDIFGKMLLSGGTSYWETEYGEADFENAGSLCHGWSAVCCWVLDKYYKDGRNFQ